jgi:ribonuclease R
VSDWPPKRGDVVQALEADPRTPAVPLAEVAERLGVRRRHLRSLRRWLLQLAREGEVVSVRGDRYGSARWLGEVVGRYQRKPAGFGFVIPDDPSERDLYVPIGADGGALPGDVVSANVVDVSPDGRREGRIRRIVERQAHEVSGIFQRGYRGGGVVEPIDHGFGFEILVPSGGALDAFTGELVRVSVTEPPHGERPARGKVVARLGRPDRPGADVELITHKYDLSAEFPAEVLAEVEQVPDDPDAWPIEGRVDLTGSLLVTIDGPTARDFDDAIGVEALPEGGSRLHVQIADVAWAVPEDSATDVEARRRGTSVYLPDRAIPMLPERLSHDLCSLRPGVSRLAQGVAIDYDARGKVRAVDFRDAIIRSAARMTYEEVQAILEGEAGAGDERPPEVREMVRRAGTLARVLAKRRARRGAVDLDLPAPEPVLGEDGDVVDVVPTTRSAATRLIEEFMIAANQAVARRLLDARMPTLYRVHERPPWDRADKLQRVLDGLGYELPGKKTRLEPADLAAVLKAAEGRPEEPFIQRLVLRSLALARYDVGCEGHFGLALDRYLHFTSPIRRYPDLVAHRSLRALRGGQLDPQLTGEERELELEEVARESSRLERTAEAAERESVRWKVATLMSRRVGEEYSGTVVEVMPKGLMVRLERPFVEGLLATPRLGPERFRYDERRQMLVGARSYQAFRLGDSVDVKVDRVDVLHQLIDFSLAQPLPRSVAASRGRRRRGGRPRAKGYRNRPKPKGRRGR